MNKYANSYVNYLINSGLNLNHANSFVSAGNPANYGFISPFHAKLQRWGLMKTPNVSDYAYKMMVERGRALEQNLPSVLASNPDLNIFGRLGQNKIFQRIYDRFAPGGSRKDAYKSMIANLSTRPGRFGLKNIQKNVEEAQQSLSNLDSIMAGADGLWDYSKSRGFNRAETVNNLGAFKRKFG